MNILWKPLGLALLYGLVVAAGRVVLPHMPWYLPNQEGTAWQTWAIVVEMFLAFRVSVGD